MNESELSCSCRSYDRRRRNLPGPRVFHLTRIKSQTAEPTLWFFEGIHVSSSKAIRHRLRMTTIQIQGLPKRARNIGVPPSCSRLNISSRFRHSYGKWPIYRWLLILPIKNADFAVRYVPALSILMLELLLLEVPPTPEHKWKSRIPSKTQYIFARPTAQERYYNYIHNLYTIIS
jgi:hypothetical protein